MPAVQGAIRQRQREFGRLVRWPWYWPLLSMPLPLVGYALSVLVAYLALAGWELGQTPLRARDLLLFATLMACGATCIEATRRLGQPTGVSRDLLSAWWLPVALLLPPFYALAAPAVLGLLLYLRVGRTPVYRRVFSSAALGLAGASASILFRFLSPITQQGEASGWLTYPAPHAWFLRPQQGCRRGALRGRVRRGQHLPGRLRRMAGRAGGQAGRHAVGPRADGARPDRDLRRHPRHDRLRAQSAAACRRAAAGGAAPAQPHAPAAQGGGQAGCQDRPAERDRLAA